MANLPTSSATILLLRWKDGDRKQWRNCCRSFTTSCGALARGYLHRERAEHTLQRTAPVHEAYLRLIDQNVEWQSRAHFFGIVAQMMRRILVDHARARSAAKRGEGLRVERPCLQAVL